MKEYQLQKAVCKYLDLQNVLYCGSMGGNYQAHMSVRMRAKNSGYKRGFPDLFIYEPKGKWHGLAIELKVGYNKATIEQLNWIKNLTEKGYVASVCVGIDEALRVIEGYLSL